MPFGRGAGSRDAWKRCLDRTGTSARVQIRGAFSPSGTPIAVDITGVDEPIAACLREAISASPFPRASSPTSFEITVDYEVTSPTTVPPLRCP